MATSICRPCLALPCTNLDDLAAGIDGALYSSLDFSFIVQCPPGCFCPPGLFPQTISILSSTIPPVIPPINEPGADIVLRLQGCTSLITRTLSAGSSQSQIAAAAQSMQAEWAGQQALCNALLTPGIDCNTGRTINVCNDAQSFPCYDGTTQTVAAGLFCKVVSIDGLTAEQIANAVAIAKAALNYEAKSSVCPFFDIICSTVYVPLINLGFSTSQVRIINVSGVTKDITPFQWCQFGGAPPTFCSPPNGFPPTSVAAHSNVVLAGGASPIPIYFTVTYFGRKVAGIGDALNPIPINQGWEAQITLGCNG